MTVRSRGGFKLRIVCDCKFFSRSEVYFLKDNLYVRARRKCSLFIVLGSHDCDFGAKRLQIVMIRWEQRRSFEILSDRVSSSFSVCVISEKELRCSSNGVKISRSEAEILLSSIGFKNERVIPPNSTRFRGLHKDNYASTL